MKKVRLLLLILSLLLLVTACKKLPTLTPSGEGDYLRSDNGLHYTEAPMRYLVVSHPKDAAVTLVDKTGEHPLYAIGKDYLCNDAGELFLPVGTTLPATLAEFRPIRLASVYRGETLLAETASSSDRSLLDEIVNAALTTEVPVGSPDSRTLLLLFSEDYPDLCWLLEFLTFEPDDETTSGTSCYLYDREENAYRIAPPSLYELLKGNL